jgi:hypothetical protein
MAGFENNQPNFTPVRQHIGFVMKLKIAYCMTKSVRKVEIAIFIP